MLRGLIGLFLLMWAGPLLAQEERETGSCERFLRGNSFVFNPSDQPRPSLQEFDAAFMCFDTWMRDRLPQPPHMRGFGEMTANLVACAPRTYADALDCLDRHLMPQLKDEIQRPQGAVSMHFGLGMWVRNQWGLWDEDAPLNQDMQRLGFTHADDMSAVIFDGYSARLRGESFDLAAQVARYRAYWQSAEQRVSMPLSACANATNLPESNLSACWRDADGRIISEFRLEQNSNGR